MDGITWLLPRPLVYCPGAGECRSFPGCSPAAIGGTRPLRVTQSTLTNVPLLPYRRPSSICSPRRAFQVKAEGSPLAALTGGSVIPLAGFNGIGSTVKKCSWSSGPDGLYTNEGRRMAVRPTKTALDSGPREPQSSRTEMYKPSTQRPYQRIKGGSLPLASVVRAHGMDFHHDREEERRVSVALWARAVRHGRLAGGAAMDVRSRCLLSHYLGNVSRRQL
ncbi:hypothetical protein OKW36_006885 [Paraburkholderia sp. MM5482-R1]